MKKTKASIVREFLSNGSTVREAASLSGANLQYVYDIKSKMNREKVAPTPKIKEEPKLAQPIVKPDGLDDLRKTIDGLRSDMTYMAAIIDYLEGRLTRHGIAI